MATTGTEPQTIEGSPSTKAVGFWSAVLTTVFSLSYVVGQLAEWQGLLGSQGGPTSVSTPLGLVVLLVPSLFLGSSFLVLVVSIHQITPVDRKVWSSAAVAFATIYAELTGTVYFVQLTFVAPRLARGEIEGMEVFLFVPFDSFLYSVDILGYSFMSVSTLLAGRVFRGRGLRRIVRWLLTANGMLLPFIALQIYYHPLIWCASLWAVTFPGATWALAILFRRQTTAFSSNTVPEP